MKLKLEPIEIDPTKLFDKDRLDRKDEIENLTALVSNINTPAVLAINSKWGMGKTTFIKLWEQHLIKENISSLYFNAWETDFSTDPLVAFLGEINESLKPLIGTSSKSKKAWKRTKAAGKQIAKRGIPVALKIATVGALDTDKIVEDEIAKAMGSLAGDALDDYLKQKSAIKEFHESLKELIETSSKDKPVVIFVDELDRCRPTYAISLLERIKHLFNIEGIVFVLALDKKQLGYSISSVYGEGIDTNGYLRRFIDIEYQLKLPELNKYISSLFAALELDQLLEPRLKYSELQYDRQRLEKTFTLLATTYKLTLREIEQLLASINLAVRTAKENDFIHPVFLAFLVVMKNIEPDIYNRFILESNSESELIKFLNKTMPSSSREDSYECAIIEAHLITAKTNAYGNTISETYIKHEEIINDELLSEEDKQYSEKVINAAGYLTRHEVNLNILVQRIEMLQHFQFEEE